MSDEMDCTLPENMEMDECMDMDKDMDDEHKGDMMTQVKWLMGSMMSATMYTLFIARYRYDAMDYYTYGDQYLGDGSMNFWKIANSIRFPASAAIFWVLTITQILSMVGVVPEINLMAHHYGLMAWMVVSMLAHAVNAYAYESAYAWYAEDTTNNAAGSIMMQVIGNEEMNMVAKETSMAMMMVFMMEKWFKGQVMMLPEEDQEMWMEKHGGKKHDDHDDHDDDHEDMEFSLNAFFGF